VDHSTKKRPASQALPEAERRRVARVVHDERGNASVRWRDAPADHERPVLELLADAGLALRAEETFDPYARVVKPRATPAPSRAGATSRTDLRRLSEHIKLMRALEERKRNGGDAD
jgi:hypothetical protein